ncbi:AhpD-like protein [Exophiala viscosa]|uniref:AhpD-like protein n=1 Tax=Exophiala viscosa TaxID=2486360 RepID=UPI00219498B6|nr:AhpD-like protein [Exophiala viscosa]
MRLPYVDPADPNKFSNTDAAAVVDRVRQRRHPRPLQPLDLTLLHSPAFADGWNSFIGAVRTKLTLPDDIREIAICRVAIRNGAWYEWHHHAPLAKAGGVSDEGMDILARDDLPPPFPAVQTSDADGLTEKQLVVAHYADAMTSDVKVSDELFGRLNKLFNDQEVVEITGTVAAYNCVSRFLVALNVGERNGPKPHTL